MFRSRLPRPRPTRLLATSMVALLTAGLLLNGCAQRNPAPNTAVPDRGLRPNIVFVLTDDLSWNLIPYMPRVRRLQQQGLTFSNYFVTNSLCCPSRASMFTGRLPHNTGIFGNEGPDGGFQAFNRRGEESQTYATSLQQRGYRTALLGKYLNGYSETSPSYVPPGWSEWYGTSLGYREYNYTLNENGRLVRYGKRPKDYLTDVLANKSVDFINRTAKTRKPFMLQISTFAPHTPFVPAPRHNKVLPKVRAPRGPAFNEGDTTDKPRWLSQMPKLTGKDIEQIDQRFRKRARMVQAVDELLGRVRQALRANGVDRDTYVVFGSDNGLHLGEHRLFDGKETAYDSDIRVPLVVSGPGVPVGRTVDRLAQNTDLCPTFQQLAGARPGSRVDGRSLVPFLRGQTVRDWRGAVLIEHRVPPGSSSDPDMPTRRGERPPTYTALRTPTELYVQYASGDREYYDLSRDPFELQNLTGVSTTAGRQTGLAGWLTRLRGCAGQSCRTADRSA